jgi:hypothetical protein
VRPRTTRHRPAFVEHRLQEPVVSYGGLRAGLRSNTMHCSQSPIGDSKYLIRRELGDNRRNRRCTWRNNG